MTERFRIRPSRRLLIWLMALHATSAILVSQFSVPLLVQFVLIMLVLISAYWQFRRWHAHEIKLEYNTAMQSWRICKSGNQWQQVSKVQPIYIAEQFIWLNFFGQRGTLIPVMIGQDSLNEANYLQLRRSVICPAALTRYSA